MKIFERKKKSGGSVDFSHSKREGWKRNFATLFSSKKTFKFSRFSMHMNKCLTNYTLPFSLVFRVCILSDYYRSNEQKDNILEILYDGQLVAFVNKVE